MIRAAGLFTSRGVTIRQVIGDNAKNYITSRDFAAITAIGAQHLAIRPHCPCQIGEVERFNRTIWIEWAYRQVFTSNDQRTAAPDPGLDFYNLRRRHSAVGGLPPISRL